MYEHSDLASSCIASVGALLFVILDAMSRKLQEYESKADSDNPDKLYKLNVALTRDLKHMGELATYLIERQSKRKP